MLKNCERFLQNRTEEGGWKTYAELEKENKILKEKLDCCDKFICDIERDLYD